MSTIAMDTRTTIGLPRRAVRHGVAAAGPGVRGARAARPTPPAALARAARSGSSTATLRLTVRGRLVVICLAVAVAVAGMLAGARAEAGGVGQGTEVTTHTVVGGETLWGIARSVGAPGQDLRDVVDDLVALNGLSSGTLQVGQQIMVPVG